MRRDEKSLHLAISAWESCGTMRSRRERYKRFTYGDQWGDPSPGTDGLNMTEGEAAQASGFRPMTNNLIRQLVKSVTGLYRRENDKNCGTDARTAEMNDLAETDARTLEEFLISGCAIQRVTTEKRTEGSGVWIDPISPAKFFVNHFEDPRGKDIEVIGMIHEMSLRETVIRFGDNDEAKCRKIARIYSESEEESPRSRSANKSFTGFKTGRCKVIELWTLEGRQLLRCHDSASGESYLTTVSEQPKLERENRRRKKRGSEPILIKPQHTLRWHCKWLTPTGEIMKEYDSPWPHGRHPFAVKFYPLTDGEVHSFVEDVTEQQKCINRMVTMIDKIMSVSAKGVLLFPTDRKPDEYTWEEIGDLWSRPGGIIPYKCSERSGEPQQISSCGNNSGATSLLDIQMRMIEQVSGVTGALQGRDSTVNTSAALYDTKTRNATTTLIDVLESFGTFIKHRNKLIAMS